MLLRKIIEENNIYEGLEITHHISYPMGYLNRWANFDDTVEYFIVDGIKLKLKADINHKLDKDGIDIILRTMNNYGYYPSSMFIYFQIKKYDYNELLAHVKNKHPFEILFEAKYDSEVLENYLPKYVYHVSPIKYKEKILRQGLVPRTGNKLSKHPERIYFSKTMDGVSLLLKHAKFKQNDVGFVIFKIDLKKLFMERNVRFFEDPNFESIGVYTLQNIPPQYLTIESEK